MPGFPAERADSGATRSGSIHTLALLTVLGGGGFAIVGLLVTLGFAVNHRIKGTRVVTVDAAEETAEEKSENKTETKADRKKTNPSPEVGQPKRPNNGRPNRPGVSGFGKRPGRPRGGKQPDRGSDNSTAANPPRTGLGNQTPGPDVDLENLTDEKTAEQLYEFLKDNDSVPDSIKDALKNGKFPSADADQNAQQLLDEMKQQEGDIPKEFQKAFDTLLADLEKELGDQRPTQPTTPRPSIPTTPGVAQRPNQEEPLVPWTAKADPPAAPVTYKPGKMSIEMPDSYGVAYPPRPSSFVLVSGKSGADEMLQVYDLRNARPIGQPVKEEIDNKGDGVFSADGRYFAAPRQEGSDTVIGVWSFATGKQVQLLFVEGGRGRLMLRFAGEHRLVAFAAESSGYFLYTFNVQTGDLLHRFQLQTDWANRIFTSSPAISQGGRYVAYCSGDVLHILDLEEAVSVGQVKLAEAPRACHGLSFSPDGSRLAGLFDISSGAQLMIWDAESGQVLVDHPYFQRMQHVWYDGQALEWGPKSETLVFRGHTLVDAKTGGEVWNFPKTDSTPRRLLPGHRILVAMADGRKNVISSAELPGKEIDKALVAVQRGGDAMDSGLPAVTSPDMFSARNVPLPNGFLEWKYSAEGIPDIVPSLIRDLPVGDTGSVIHQLMMAGTERSHLVVRREGATQGAGRANRAFMIERYEISSGKRSKSLPIPAVYRVLDVTPNTEWVLAGKLTKQDKFDRLDVMDLTLREHITGFRPYQGDAEHKFVDWVTFIGSEQLLTANTHGKLVLWSLPDCKAVYVCEQFGTPIAISPTRRHVACVQEGTFRLFDAVEGEFAGDLESPKLANEAARAAFRSDGRELAAVINNGNGHSVVIWNLEDGKITSTFPLPGLAIGYGGRAMKFYQYVYKNLEWRGDGHLLLDNRFLINVANRAVVWEYVIPDGNVVARTQGSRQWYCAPTGVGLNKTYAVKWVEMPSSNVRQQTASLRLEDQLLLQPGGSIGINVSFGHGGSDDLRRLVASTFTEYFRSRDIQVSSNAPVQLNFSTREVSTGQQIGVSRFGGFGGDDKGKFDQKRMEYTIKLTDRSGKVHWQTQGRSSMRSFGMVESDNAQTQLRNEMSSSFEAMVRGVANTALPTYIFKGADALLAGRSALSSSGEGPYQAPKPNTGGQGGDRPSFPGFGPDFGPGDFGPRRPGGFGPGGFGPRPGGFRPGGFGGPRF